MKKIVHLRLTVLAFSLFVVQSNFAQFNASWGKLMARQNVYHLSPPNWYIGLNGEQLEIIIHAENIDQYELSMEPYEGVEFIEKTPTANRHINYLSLKINKSAKPGNLKFIAQPKENQNRYLRPYSFEYELLSKSNTYPPKITSQDITYLVFPDRFANGDESNDNAEVQFPQKVNRNELKGRHGGDIEGIKEKLNYFQELGITTLWLNPVQENDQDFESFHGYAITDHYKIDPRLGTNASYLKLCTEMKQRNMKMVMDIIPNHVGNNHWMYKDYDTTWFNFRDTFIQTNYRANTVVDIYASQNEKILNADGAFVRTMPDYNQRNPHIKTYLDQMYLWWIEFAGLSGYRIDTYPYPDQDYMNHLCELILSNYPDFVIYGEVWVESTPVQVAFTRNNIKGFEKNRLPGVTDFVLSAAMIHAGTKPYGWLEGVNKMYQVLGEDYLYENPNKNLTFLDNHDVSRIYSVLNEDFNAWKRCMSLLFTLRGMPCIYYGTEILMKGKTAESDAYVRFDFPGGWKSDSENKFKKSGRTAQEEEAFNYIRTLALFRQKNAVFLNGKTMQFAGKDHSYAYVRYTENQAVLCVYNQKNEVNAFDMERIKERTKGYSAMRNIFTNERINIDGKPLLLPANGSEVYELIK